MVVCRALYKWWAQYMHSQGDLKAAISHYEKANDILALTKIYCGANDVAKVVRVHDTPQVFLNFSS